MTSDTVTHINMQGLCQRARRGDGLSFARTYFIGSSVGQLCSHSSEDPRPVNHPVTIDDGDASLGLQSWSRTLKLFLLIDAMSGIVQNRLITV